MSHDIRDILINSARSFIYSTALPPSCAATAIASIDILIDNPHMGKQLIDRSAEFRRLLNDGGIQTASSVSQIVPIYVGDNSLALSLARLLQDDGIWAVAIRPPTVPAGSARIRLAISLAHNQDDLERTANIIITHCKQLGVSS